MSGLILRDIYIKKEVQEMAKNYEKYAFLDRLTTEQLEELLYADFALPESGDEDVIFHILEVIEKREKDQPTSDIPDVEKSWADFQKYYEIPEGHEMSLYPSKLLDTSTHESEVKDHVFSKHQTRISIRHIFKQSFVAAVAIAFILGGMIAVQAAGIDVFGAIGRWTDETFHFTPTSQGTIQEIFAESSIDKSLIPTWIPEGFENSEPTIIDTELSFMVNVEFENNNNQFFSINIREYHSPDYINTYLFEKDTNGVTTYSHGTMTFYILENLDTLTATWSNGILVEQISGNISMDELKAIIDSIGETQK